MKVLIRFSETVSGRLALIAAVALVGFAVASSGSAPDPGVSPWYLWGVNGLLAVGLYGSASGIPRSAVGDLRTVVLAVTVGVLLKTAIIAVVLYAVSGRPEAMILGVAVAQIDPLSVAAIIGRSQMSQRAKSLLLAWASFDDPVTALLTIYLITLVLGGGGGLGSIGGVPAYLTNLGLNLAFAGAVLAGWSLTRRIRRRGPGGSPPEGGFPGWFRIAAAVVLAALIAVAAWQFLMLGIALVGLFYRPGIDALVERITALAFYVATFVVGLLLVGGVDLRLGAVLGVAAFCAQIVAGLLIARRLPATDRVYLALGQQNGITAVILALALQPHLPYAVGVVAPAILTVNILNIVTNGVWDRVRSVAVTPARTPSPTPAPARPAGPGPPRPRLDGTSERPDPEARAPR